ncbi:MAG: hypothetical protein WD033_06140 [Nitrosopumilaceae archaeon]
MKSRKEKPTSVRLPPDLLEEVDQKCEEIGCSRNDYFKSVLELALSEENSTDLKSQDPKQEATPSPITEKPPIAKLNIIPELKHNVKTESSYVTVNGQYFKKCDPLPKATNVRIFANGKEYDASGNEITNSTKIK